jgi:hypothetical protein
MKTKEQAIQEAYGRFYDAKKHHYSINGWSNPESYTEEEMYEMMQEIKMEFGEHRCRPKSLEGIENNRGWIRIESEEDLPKDSGFFFVRDNQGDISIVAHRSDNFNAAACFLNFTHYQPIEKPKPPIY